MKICNKQTQNSLVKHPPDRVGLFPPHSCCLLLNQPVSVSACCPHIRGCKLVSKGQHTVLSFPYYWKASAVLFCPALSQSVNMQSLLVCLLSYSQPSCVRPLSLMSLHALLSKRHCKWGSHEDRCRFKYEANYHSSEKSWIKVQMILILFKVVKTLCFCSAFWPHANSAWIHVCLFVFSTVVTLP